ncbi:MAG: hypothetical protein Q4E62_03150 [Sutterellaceae bacterium]|nr:hypothetical protein [Sutterellaceae bacterium]
MSDNLPTCYGMYSCFSNNSQRCRGCEQFLPCGKTCLTSLKEMCQNYDVAKFFKKHAQLMATLGVKNTPDYKASRVASSKEMDFLVQDLVGKGLIKDKWVADDLSSAPAFFETTVKLIREFGVTTAPRVVNAVKDRLVVSATDDPDKAAMGMAALAVQILVKFKLIEVVGEKITWKE